MIRDFVLELVAGPGIGSTITLPGSAPAGRITWAAGFGTSQPVLYILDDTTFQEWGLGLLTVGSPSTITRPTVVLGNSLGTTARVNFADTCRCFCALPSKVVLNNLAGGIARNLFHNATDRIQQRTGPWTAAGYTTDRWLLATGTAGGTRTVSALALTDAARTAIGDEEAEFALNYVFSGGAGAGDFDAINQRVEGVRRTANKTVTVSFWASASAAIKIGVNLTQNFGTGGSPSASVVVGGQNITATPTWTRYSLTFVVPSVAGKTFGTTRGTDYLQVGFWVSSGTTNNGAAGGINVQAGTVSLYGRQIEISSVATPLEKQDIRYDLANCQRFFQTLQSQLSCYAPAAGSVPSQLLTFALMRALPTITQSGQSFVNCTAATITPAGTITSNTATTALTCTAAGSASATALLALTADL